MTIVQSELLDSVLFRIYLQAQNAISFMVAVVLCISSTHNLNLYCALFSVQFLAMYHRPLFVCLFVCFYSSTGKINMGDTLRYDVG